MYNAIVYISIISV